MTKYTAPNEIRKRIARARRNAPGFVVDVIDNVFRLARWRAECVPYHSNTGMSPGDPFFIVGSGRSGNTLLRKLLIESSSVVIPPEIPGLGNTIRAFSRNRCLGWDTAVQTVLAEFRRCADVVVETRDASGRTLMFNLMDELDLDLDSIADSLATVPVEFRSLSTILLTLYERYGVRRLGVGRARMGDKTPWNVFHFERLDKAFPRAQYIHMLRDGRDCVASYVDSLGALMNMDYADAAYRWRDAVRKAERIRKATGARFIEVRYEELVTNPEASTGRVIDFLKVERVAERVIGVEELGDTAASHHKKLAKKVDAGSVGRWRTSIPKKELPRVLRIIGRDLELRGYALD